MTTFMFRGRADEHARTLRYGPNSGILAPTLDPVLSSVGSNPPNIHQDGFILQVRCSASACFVSNMMVLKLTRWTWRIPETPENRRKRAAAD